MVDETLYHTKAMRWFDGIELGDDRIRDETTPLSVRHLLERRDLAEVIFADVNAHLAEKGIMLRSSMLVDATIIDAPSSTENQTKARDPEMSLRRTGNDWYFGVNANGGMDVVSGTVHSLEATTRSVHDGRGWDELLYGEEKSVWADKGYISAAREAAFSIVGEVWSMMRKGSKLDPIDEKSNRIIAMVRAKVEHPYRVIKRQFGHLKTRCCELAWNRAQLLPLFALCNLFPVRRRLIA